MLLLGHGAAAPEFRRITNHRSLRNAVLLDQLACAEAAQMASQFVHVLQNDNWAHAARPRDHVHWCSSEPAPVMSAMSPGAHDATFQRPTASSAAAHNLQPPVLPTSAPTEITAPEIFSGAAGLADGDGPRTRSAEKRLAARKGGVEGYSNHPEIQRAESSQLQRQQSQTNEAWKSSSLSLIHISEPTRPY